MMNTAPAQVLESKPFDGLVQEFADLSDGLFSVDDFKNVDIKFSQTIAEDTNSPNAVGVCWMWSGRIQIDPIYWNQNPLERRSLLFHELGHCHCGLDHPIEITGLPLLRILNGFGIRTKHGPFLSDGCPKTIMHPEVVGRFCMERHFDYYIKELFGQCRKKIQLDEMMMQIRRMNIILHPINKCEK